MSAYPAFRLGDIANVVAGDPAPQERGAFAPDGPLFVRMQDVGQHHVNPSLADTKDRLSVNWLAGNRLRLFPKDSILIPKSGASVSLNHRAKLATDAHVVSHLAVVMPYKDRVDPEYLFWWSVRYDPRAQAQVTSLPSLKLSTLKEVLVPLPPLDEQRRIASILNRAAKIERLRARARELMEEFIPALFVRMFGDPVENPMGWEIRHLGELVEEFRYGTSRKCSTEASDGQLPILRIPNVLRNVIDWNEVKFAALDDREANAIRLEDGDILLVRTNGNPEYIGRCAVFCDNRPAAYASYLIRARLRSGGFAVSEYIAGALSNVMMRKVILGLARTTAGNYNINIASLGSLALPVPPIERQRRYTQLVQTTRSAIAVAESGCRTTPALSITLMSRLLDAGA